MCCVLNVQLVRVCVVLFVYLVLCIVAMIGQREDWDLLLIARAQIINFSFFLFSIISMLVVASFKILAGKMSGVTKQYVMQ